MNIGLLVFLVSVVCMIGLGVYALLDNLRKRRALAAGRNAALAANRSKLANIAIAASFRSEYGRRTFCESVSERLELTGLIAVPISDEWREQMKTDDLVLFMHENGCKLRMDGTNLVLYVPSEDIATMARLAL